MASCVTSLILLFAFIGEVINICDESGVDNAVPVCTDCSKTGTTVLIDTSMVPRNANVICICHIAASDTPAKFIISYHGPNYKPCNITFKLMSYNFSCMMNGPVSIDGLSEIRFRKGYYIGKSPAANLSITVDQTNATVTVTCKNMTERPGTSSVPVSVTTARTFSWTEESTLQSSSAESSSTIMATTTISVTQTTFTTPNTLTDETMLNHSQELASDNKTGMLYECMPTDMCGCDIALSKKVVIAGACGGAGGILLLILMTILLLCLHRNRVQKPKNKESLPKVANLNSAFECEVTENVVYNLEFSDETKYGHEPLDEANITCNSVHSDTQKQAHATNTIPTYQNQQVYNDNETFDSNYVDSEQQTHNIPIVTQFENQQLDENGGAYNDVDFEHTTDTKIKQNNNTQQSSEIDSELFYGQNKNAKTSFNISNAISKQNLETEATYAVVNKNKPNDIGYERQKQFQVPESNETYALVNKESVK